MALHHVGESAFGPEECTPICDICGWCHLPKAKPPKKIRGNLGDVALLIQEEAVGMGMARQACGVYGRGHFCVG